MLETIGADLLRNAELARAKPKMMEVDHPGRPPHGPERMDVAVAVARPVLEGNAKLECRPRGADEILFGDPHIFVEGARRGDGGLAHADGPDLVGFYQRDPDEVAELRRERISGDPTRRAAASDDDAPDRLLAHSAIEPLKQVGTQAPRRLVIERCQWPARMVGQVRCRTLP